MKYLIITMTAYALIFNCSCSDNGTKPPVKIETDTTSHDFSWRIDTLGTWNSSLFDVAVLDSLVWAVGDIQTDSSDYFGLAISDGVDWQFEKLSGSDIPVQSSTPRGIHVLDRSNIWFAEGSILKWNGFNTAYVFIAPTKNESVSKIWADNENNIFFVGSKGAILHYDGSAISQMHSGTDIDLTDVWGTSPSNVWACGYDEETHTAIILHYDGQNWSTFYLQEEYWRVKTDVVSGLISTIWTDNEDSLWTVTYHGLYRINSKDVSDFKRIEPSVYAWNGYDFKIRGHSSKDIMFGTDRSSIWHYNGKTVAYYNEFVGRTKIRGLSVYLDGFVIVGSDYDSHRAIVYWAER